MHFLINFTSLAIEQTKLPLGLALNKKDMAFGFTIEAASPHEASAELMKIEARLSKWVQAYNWWLGDAKRNNTGVKYELPASFADYKLT